MLPESPQSSTHWDSCKARFAILNAVGNRMAEYRELPFLLIQKPGQNLRPMKLILYSIILGIRMVLSSTHCAYWKNGCTHIRQEKNRYGLLVMFLRLKSSPLADYYSGKTNPFK